MARQQDGLLIVTWLQERCQEGTEEEVRGSQEAAGADAEPGQAQPRTHLSAEETSDQGACLLK